MILCISNYNFSWPINYGIWIINKLYKRHLYTKISINKKWSSYVKKISILTKSSRVTKVNYYFTTLITIWIKFHSNTFTKKLDHRVTSENRDNSRILLSQFVSHNSRCTKKMLVNIFLTDFSFVQKREFKFYKKQNSQVLKNKIYKYLFEASKIAWKKCKKIRTFIVRHGEYFISKEM